MIVLAAVLFACVVVMACMVAASNADRKMELFPDMDATLSPREQWAIDNEVSTFLDEFDRYTAENPQGVCRGHKTRADAIDALADYLEADHGVRHYNPLRDRE